jgi:predicted transcriptional regulator
MTTNKSNARRLDSDGQTIDVSTQNNTGAAAHGAFDPDACPAEEWHELRGFQRDLLKALSSLGSVKGLAVKERLETFYDGEINHGRLYPNLDELVEKGLVEKGTTDGRTNAYRLTDRGQTVLQERDQLLQGGKP